ncbi:hypothetical protein MF672_007145 [Actinomadura sp. ATCC 31491]|uniref:HEAT repeat domain-containing protein n=1 Tax=Actinomadura luzonensis TaxID=2805427 RepID=A0ABT0FMU7_9ACTN|nr:hypothetical protein [Actinomadura luzonensis]MCK2213569.1 hypothetical protein [Actinomadura luzonensis]
MTDTPEPGELDLDDITLTQRRLALNDRLRASVPPVTGDLARRAADALLRSYLEPPCFAEAVRRLAARHLLVLVGAEETGKRLGGLALLSRMSLAESTITVLSPARTAAELLSGTEYAPGRAYLLHDWIAPGTDRTELVNLARKLAELGSYLVVTRNGVPSRAVEVEQPWAAPDPGELFELCLRTYDLRAGRAPEALARARGRAAELPTPAQVVRLAAGLAPGGRPAGEEVAAWFDTKPAMREVLAAAALAFVQPLPEAAFHAQLGRLDRVWQAHEGGPRLLPGPHPLIAVTGGQAAFRTPEHRGPVLAELAARYGFWLWQPLRAWVRSLPAEGPEVRARAAEGVAALAAHAFREARHELLEVWAAGTAGERLAAADALTHMCADDALVPEALRLALDWAADPGRATTAAAAFGGGLSVRYPDDALRALRRLAGGDGPAAAVAARTLTLLGPATAAATVLRAPRRP